MVLQNYADVDVSTRRPDCTIPVPMYGLLLDQIGA